MTFIIKQKKGAKSLGYKYVEEECVVDNILEIGSLNLFFLLYSPCCLKNKNNQSDFMKRCVKLINQYAQIDSIIRCQIDVNFLKHMLLTENQKIYLKNKLNRMPIDDLKYSNELLEEFENLIKDSPKKK